MPTIEWLKKEFHYGYRSGDILAPQADETRRSEEIRCGADYRFLFLDAVAPHLKEGASVLELGPGNGSWTRAMLQHGSDIGIQTVDFQDVTKWLEPERWNGRLRCHQVSDSTFSCIGPASIDFFFSFGVLCHNNQANIANILRGALSRMKPGGMALHQHGDWTKLERFGWQRGMVPLEFRSLPDDEIWWPRNDGETMSRIARETGWEVVQTDLGHIERDGFILLRAPGAPSAPLSGEPADPAKLLHRGLAEMERSEHAAALSTAERALGMDLPQMGLHMLRAAALLHLGREEEGITALRREIELFPGNKDARDALSDLLPPKEQTSTTATAPSGMPQARDSQVYINLGCGRRFHRQWRNFDLAPSDASISRFDVRERLPLTDGEADAVYHSHLLEHLPLDDARAFLSECRRVLRPGGTLRVAVPDLEAICRQYLSELDTAVRGDEDAEVRKEWMVLEMLDQVSRHRSGGEMARWWSRTPVAQEDFIVRRNGDEAREGIAHIQRNPSPPLPDPRDPTEVGRFRLSGEVHRHMYDRLSLAKILVECGFRDPRRVEGTESAIPGFAAFLLDTDEQGRLRKPDSLYVEATRP